MVSWAQTLPRYEEALAAKDKKGKGLLELDSWYRQELGPAIASRSPPHLTHEELVKLVEWKLARGTWRPRLLEFAKQQDASAVRAASQTAIKHLTGSAPKDTAGAVVVLKRSLGQLTTLKGVGPATASAVLAAVCSEAGVELPPTLRATAVFMSDELLRLSGCKKGDYSDKAFVHAAEWTARKVEQLNQVDKQQSWTAQSVEQAVFAAELLELQLDGGPAPEGGDAAALGSKRRAKGKEVDGVASVGKKSKAA